MTKNIKQTVTFKAIPHEVYELFMDSKKHSQFTGDKAVISRKVGGKFTAFGGYAEGTNLELIPDKKIVQKWRTSDWPEGHYSQITLSLMSNERGTRLTFTQSGVPDDQYDDILQGWRDYYWSPMKEMLTKE